MTPLWEPGKPALSKCRICGALVLDKNLAQHIKDKHGG